MQVAPEKKEKYKKYVPDLVIFFILKKGKIKF